jgi:uncharacterized protein
MFEQTSASLFLETRGPREPESSRVAAFATWLGLREAHGEGLKVSKLAVEIDDVVVLLLGAPSSASALWGCLEGITRLEKLVFLLERETSLAAYLSEDADFIAFNFGPFSLKVYQEVETLVAAGLLTDSARQSEDTADAWERLAAIDAAGELRPADAYTTRSFALTDLGRRYYDVLASQLSPKAVDELSGFKDRFAMLPLRQLVRYVYENYPEFTERSLIRDDILGQPPWPKAWE